MASSMIGWTAVIAFCAVLPARSLGSDEALVAEILPSVVQVFVDIGPQDVPGAEADWAPDGFEHYFGPRRGPRDRGQGSGFLVEPPGTVVTCAHVVRDAVSCRVRLNDGREVAAQVIGEDPTVDLAILQISVPEPALPTLRWGRSALVRPGQLVFSFGSPLGFFNTVSKGIIGGVAREGPWEGSPGFLQTDAFLGSGSSGGPLVNRSGEVIGINSWIVTGGGRRPGFALPSDLAKEVVHGLLPGASGTGASGWLGVLPAGLPGPGVAVFDVMVGSPADRAGLRPGDRIVTAGPDSVLSEELLRAVLDNRPVGSAFAGRIEPGGRRFEARLGMRPSRWDGGMREASTAPPVPVDPGVLEAVLTGRDCPCPCGRTLQNCFGCSAAKSDFTDARRYLGQGRGDAEVGQMMDPPVPALVWFDPTDEPSRALLRQLEVLVDRYAGAMRVRRRYFPASRADQDVWARAVVSLEVARSEGRYDEVFASMLDSPGEKRWEGVAEVAGVDVDQALDAGLFDQQLARDLTAAPTQYGIDTSPALFLLGARYEGEFEEGTLAGHIDSLLLRESF